MNIGIIGCGRITEKHLSSLNQISNARVTALSDLSFERMKQAATQISSSVEELPQLFDHYHDLLQTDSELVVIATTSGTHVEIAEAALKAGKHVLVEKPLSLSIEESRMLTKLADVQGKQLFVCHQLRFRKILNEIKTLIDSGKLGTIHLGTVSMSVQRPTSYYEAAPWRGTWDQDGGMLINQGIHMVDLLIWYMGKVQSVSGQLQWVNTQKETEDIALGMVTFCNGATGLIEANSVTYPHNHGYAIKLFAEKGTIIIEGSNFDQLTRATIEGEPWSEDVSEWLTDKDEQVKMYKEVIKSITGLSNTAVMAKEAEFALETIFALYQSHKLASSVSLPLSSFSTTDMKGVN
ncbi:Gfo/Idh/MocA family protein [Alkalicoccobacillus murimartini]|uniref:Dehydrogenase n=1 Tax=Alkalicoccobacillus murimartini TaxID=171685 RepID=A0ABT9YLG9_9BACI|nr:Gfo/Idh/MocA family oxidoreductase [Alkalicoccobacillus murimartini]MDQ0207869.1 putative dehydrogenase [Alkalicoccobacillus murimartini]